MSEGVSALPGAVFDGLARIEDTGLRGMVIVRGDLGAKALQDAVTAATGASFPEPGKASEAGAAGLCWMAPDELLVIVPHAEAAATVGKIGEALTGTHHLVADLSDARSVFAVSGPGAREVLAKLTPADLHPDVFGPGQFRRTRLAQAAAAIWMRGEDRFEVFCSRSQATYVFDLLQTAAQPGAGVGYF